ncbi:MAG: isocitrate/isopropylmalate dehydrogenase family protein [Candidatus Bathyarchaeota archaeon]|nr:MAG: isocitrate/isopropylmalate dehydrogenase family protein [Candidatus Bathyarchaeota archaeon]
MYKIAVIPGDGIGKIVTPETIRVLESIDLKFEFQHMEVGYEVFKKVGTSVPEDVISSLRNTQACLFGATTTPVDVPNYRSAVVTLRKALDLYANVRPARSYPIRGQVKDVDLVIVRENTEGLYSGIEFATKDSAFAMRVITRRACERVARFAFDLAMRRRRKLIVVTKANIMRKTCGLFREVTLFVAENYPEVEVDEMFVDAAAMNLVLKPQVFDVILTSNLFGDILSDEAAGLVGGLGLAPSANIGDDYGLFEPVHGSAPDIAGKGIANPIAAILSAKMLLDFLGEVTWAERVENAVSAVLKKRKYLTPDLGGSSTTREVTEAIISALEKI